MEHLVNSTQSGKFKFLSKIPRKLKGAISVAALLVPMTAFSAESEERKYVDILEKNGNWLYDFGVDVINEELGEFQFQIEDQINEFFKDEVFPELIDLAEIGFGSDAANFLTTLSGAGPWFSFAALAVGGLNSGPSESEIMIRVILEALEGAKSEIIDAVNANFQDETIALLDSIILDLDIYSTRGLLSQSGSFETLAALSNNASLVKKRFEARDDEIVKNSHWYLLISTLHAEVQKHYTKHLVDAVYESLSEAEKVALFEEEYNSVLGVLVRDALDNVLNKKLGTRDAWKSEFENSFGYEVEYIGVVPQDEIPSGISGEVHYVAYSMNDKPIKFMVTRSGCNGIRVKRRSYVIYDALGEKYSGTTSSCSKSVPSILGTIESSIARMIDVHKLDPKSLDKYIIDGYTPIKEVFDDWVSLVDVVDTNKSEVELLVESGLKNSYPSNCSVSGTAGIHVGTAIKGQGYSIGLAERECYPCGVNTRKSGWTTNYYCNNE